MLSLIFSPFRAIRDVLARHKNAVAATGAVAVAYAGYHAYQKLAPLVTDVRSMLQLMEEQQKADAAKARENDPCAFIRFRLLFYDIFSLSFQLLHFVLLLTFRLSTDLT